MVYFFDYKVMIGSLIIYLILIGVALYKRKKEPMFYLVFTIFYIYINYVVKYTQFPIYNDEFQRSVLPAYSISYNVNFIPFRNTLHLYSLLNVVMTIPFGFLLPFVARMNRMNIKKVISFGALFSLALELTQMTIGLVIGYTTRTTDINDIICNTIGAVIGYIMFCLFIKLIKQFYKTDTSGSKILNYILNCK